MPRPPVPLRSRRDVGAAVIPVLAVILVLAGILLRIIFPEADALHPRWSGWMIDEGRWTELAREWALFRAPDLDSPVSRIHLILAPLYQGVVAAVFELRGVSLENARLVSALAGIGLLLIVAVGLRRTLRPKAWLVAVALVALHPELVYFSRIAIPEMAALTVGTAAFLLLVKAEPTRATDLVAGVFTALALGVKGTAAPLMLVFAAIPFLVSARQAPRRPIERVRTWALGFGGPVVVGAVAALVVTGFSVGPDSLRVILGFLGLARPYEMGATLLLGADSDQVNVLLAALAPLSAMVWVLSPGDSPARRLYLGALAWASTWLVLLVALEYFPFRYLAHLHVALILAIAGAVSLLEGTDLMAFRDRLAALSGPRRIAIGTLAAAPVAVVVVPAGLVGVDALGLNLERLRIFVPLLLVSAVLGGWIAVRRDGRWLFGGALVAFPWAATLAWRGVHGPAAGRWWTIDAATTLGPWALAAGAGVVGILLARVALRHAPWGTRLSTWTLAYLAGLVMVWSGTRHVSTLFQPTWTFAAVSSDLATRYPAAERVGVSSLTTALVDTPYRYREVFGTRPLPRVVFLAAKSRADLAEEGALVGYRVVEEFSVPLFRYRGRDRPLDRPDDYELSPFALMERIDPEWQGR
ncbi:MAG TPA: glycosyltransferase family 39 protein [Longimicrobiales bacterium]|nr:glycosyltransferase family 39 protein [Longimicrobiales bacterium]